MKKALINLVCVVLVALQAPAQSNFNQAGGIANAYPLNNLGTSRKVQWFIPAASLGTLTTGMHNITNVYFQAGTSATQVYPVITVKLKSGTGMTNLSGTAMEPGMTVVFTSVNYTLTTIGGNWFMFPLPTPFAYDASQPLIVEMEHNATTGTGPSVYQTAIAGVGAHRQYADYNTSVLTGSDGTRRINFGVDVSPYCTISISSSASGTNNAAICSGASVTLTTNGVSNYSWSTGSTASSLVVSPVATTVYSLSATSPLACNGSQFYTVTVNSAVPSLTLSGGNNTMCLGSTAALTANGAITYTWSHAAANGATFIPTSTMNYSVSGENGCGISTAVTSITVDPLPVTISAGAPTVCAGSNAIFTVNAAANSYTWFPQNAITTNSVFGVSPIVNTIYTVVASNGTCKGDGTVSITAHPVPTISILATATAICEGESVNLTVNGANSITWTPASLTGTMVTVSPTMATNYQATGDNQFGCLATAQHVVLVNSPPPLNTSFTSTTVCVGTVVEFSASGAGTYSWSTSATGPTISLPATNPVTVTVTGGHSTNTCVVAKSVFVNPVSPVLAVSPSTAICLGAQTTLTVQATSGISWLPEGGSFPFPTVSPSVSTTYSVSAMVSTLGVVCTASNTIQVTVNPLPVVTASASRSAMCRNEINTFSAGGADAYVWSNQKAGQTITVTATQSSLLSLTVTGTDANGCKATAAVQVQVSPCTGIDALDVPAVIHVYPVPAHDVVFIESEVRCEVRIINLTGQTVRTLQLNENLPCEVSDLARGVYSLVNVEGRLLKRVVVD